MSVGNMADLAERPPFVQFETRAIQDHVATRESGHVVYIDEIFALITPPGSKDRHEEKAEVWIQKQEVNARSGRVNPNFIAEWKKGLQAFKEGREVPLDGHDIRNWPAVSKADIKNLLAIKVRTVEDLAALNTEGVRRIGMNGTSLKNAANDWLQANKDHAPLVLKLNELESENAILRDSVENLEKQVAFLSSKPPGSTEQPSSDILTPAQRYENKFGKPPHHKMKDETILAKLGE